MAQILLGIVVVQMFFSIIFIETSLISSGLNDETQRFVLCEHAREDTRTISCPLQHQRILIIYAMYGRKSKTTCAKSTVSVTNCGSPSSQNKARMLCDGKRTCVLSARNSMFGDPCVNVVKYLEVAYVCQTRPDFSTWENITLIGNEPRQIVKNSMIKKLNAIPLEYIISLEVKATTFKGTEWTNVLHCTTSGDTGRYGYRHPALWFHKVRRGAFQFVAAVKVKGKNETAYWFDSSKQVEAGTWNTVTFQQLLEESSSYRYSVYLNGHLERTVINTEPMVFHNVYVYTSDPWFDAQLGYIRNFVAHLKDINECNGITNPCHPNVCVNTIGSYKCRCHVGFHGNGTYCKDIDECSNAELHGCHQNAVCSNVHGSYTCTCNKGYAGDGTSCVGSCQNFTCRAQSTCRVVDDIVKCVCDEGHYKDPSTGTCMLIKYAYMSRLPMNKTFTRELDDPRSKYYQSLASFVRNMLLSSIQDSISSVVDIQVTSFVRGSVIANYIIIIDSTLTTNTVTASDISSAIQYGLTMEASEIMVPPLYRPVVKDFNRCLFNLTNDCHGDHILCIQNGASYTCRCKDGYFKSGSTCEELSSAMLVIFTINNKWSPRLLDPKTDEYVAFERTIKTELLNSFNKVLSRTISSTLQVVNITFRNASGLMQTLVNISHYKHTSKIKGQLCEEIHKELINIKLPTLPLLGTIDINSYDCCLKNVIGLDSYKGRYTFNTTLTSHSVIKRCKYNTNITMKRICHPNTETGAKWSEVNLERCLPKSVTTIELNKLNNTFHCDASSTNTDNCATSVEIAERLNKLVSNNGSVTTPKDISFIADITTHIVHGNFTREMTLNVTENFLETIGNIMQTNRSLIASAEKTDSSAASLLTNIDTIATKIGTSLSTVGDNVTINTKSIAMQVAKVKSKDIKVYSRFNPSHEMSVGVSEENQESSDFLALVSIPNSTFSSSEGVVYSQAYLENTLFIDGDEISALEDPTKPVSSVQSVVLSVSFSNQVESLEQPIILQFKEMSSSKQLPSCVFWNFKGPNKRGTWDTKGCTFLNRTNDGVVSCKCTHLTNFALLLDVYQTGSNPESLQIVTWIGCIISLIGLSLTIFIFSSFRHLRGKLPSKILISLCVSLIIFLIVFLAGVEKAKHRVSCQVIAGILHYFMMTSFTWMCVAAVNLYMLLVLIFRKGSDQKFFIKASVLAWGVPLIIVIVTAVSEPENLGNNRFCFPQEQSAHFGVLLPVVIILLVNFTLFIIILVTFGRNKRPVANKEEQNHHLRQVRIGLSISVLLGLSWILAIFAVKDAEFVFQLLFCIFNSLQGFFIFVLYALTSEQVKKQISKAWYKNVKQTESSDLRSTTDQNRMSATVESNVDSTIQRNMYADDGPSTEDNVDERSSISEGRVRQEVAAYERAISELKLNT